MTKQDFILSEENTSLIQDVSVQEREHETAKTSALPRCETVKTSSFLSE